MTVEVMATDRELLRADKEIPNHLKGMCVLLKFGEAISRQWVGDFYRIQLHPEMMQKAEDKFHSATIWQPQRTGVKRCGSCGQKMVQTSPVFHVCENRRCELSRRPQNVGPVRGVVRVLITDDFVERVEEVKSQRADGSIRVEQIEFVDKVALILDRRYEDSVRIAIHRAAKDLAAIYGWNML